MTVPLSRPGENSGVYIKFPLKEWHKSHWKTTHCSQSTDTFRDALVWSCIIPQTNHAFKVIPLPSRGEVMSLEANTQTHRLSVLPLPFSLLYLLGFWRKSIMSRSCMLSWNTSGASKSRCHREVSFCTWETSVRNETISLTKVSWYCGLCCTLTKKNVWNYLRTRRNCLITRSLAAGGSFYVFQLALHLHASLQTIHSKDRQ